MSEQASEIFGRLEEQVVNTLMRMGIGEADAKYMAHQQVYSMGSTKTLTGTCPLGAIAPAACMVCTFGHMTACHYPQTCEQAQCSHWQQMMAAEEDIGAPGFDYDLPTEAEIEQAEREVAAEEGD